MKSRGNLFLHHIPYFAHSYSRKGDHWSLLILSRSAAYAAPVFIHVDTMPTDERTASLDFLVGQVKDHIHLLIHATTVDEGTQQTIGMLDEEAMDDALASLAMSSTIHSRDVECPVQAGLWECGYNVMHLIGVLTRSNCSMLYSVDDAAGSLNFNRLYQNHDANDFRTGLAQRALKESEDQRSWWIQTPVSVDSTVWMPCEIVKISMFGISGGWYRLSYRIGENRVLLWCKLPTVQCNYWKHSD
jgi:hypothetical protein